MTVAWAGRLVSVPCVNMSTNRNDRSHVTLRSWSHDTNLCEVHTPIAGLEYFLPVAA